MNLNIFAFEPNKVDAQNLTKTFHLTDLPLSVFSKQDKLLDALSDKPAIIILDITTGVNLLTLLCNDPQYDDISIIVFRARNAQPTLIERLNRGPDDYLDKPINPDQILYTVRERLRMMAPPETVITHGDFRLNLIKRTTIFNDANVPLTKKEFDILAVLVRAMGKVVSRKQILMEIWHSDADLATRTIDMHVQSLRKKLGDIRGQIILTVFGVGYKLAN